MLTHSGRFDSAPRALKLHRFVPRTADDDHAYWRSLHAAWGSPDVLVNVEWDMAFSQSLVDDLLTCLHPLCTHAYQMHLPSTYYAHSTRSDAMDGFWIGHGDEWAAYSGIGFCKITPGARARPLGRNVWRGVELEVNAATEGRWHVHWPAISHYHKEPRCVPESAVS